MACDLASAKKYLVLTEVLEHRFITVTEQNNINFQTEVNQILISY